MADPKIPLADLPYGLPGAYDKVAGVDTATGASRLFPLPQAGVPLSYATRASLPAASGFTEGYTVWVNNDPTPANNGTWAVLGGVWVQSADRVSGLEQAVSKVSNAAGKINGWPDPFFRELDLTNQTFLGRDRWYWSGSGGGAFAGYSRVVNPIFDGYALRRSADAGTTPLNGPSIWLDEMGAGPGDTITVYALFVGTGAVAQMRAKFDNGAQLPPGQGQISGGTVTTSSTPQWIRYEVTVPAGAKTFDTYFFTPTAGQSFDVVAMWAFKGAATAGPVWPTLADASASIRADEIEGRVGSLEGYTASAAAYAVDAYDTVQSDSETITLNGTGFSTNPRDDVFMGWGERYSPAGVSFNAIRIRQISRAQSALSKWRTLNVVIRTGATPHVASAPVVAVGSAIVVESEDLLSDVTVILRDPSTGAVKTLTDASFSGGEYFIGVYARNRSGSPAACGEPRGTMPNTVGQAYYKTSAANDPVVGTWSTASGVNNVRQGFQHLLLTNPEVVPAFRPSDEFAAQLADSTAIPAPEMVMPSFIYAVQNRECNVYFDNLHVGVGGDYLHDVTTPSSVGAHQNERWTWTPASGLASGTITVSAHDKRTGVSLVSKTAQLRAAIASAGDGTTKACMFIGDSLIAAGTITQTLLDIAAGDTMGVTMMGTKGSGPNRHEGRGGWSITSYTTNFSDVPNGANPFWIGGQVDFPAYLSANSYSAPDWVFIHLGINDVFSSNSDADAESRANAAFNALDVLVASIKAAGGGVKVALMVPPPPSSDQDSFGANYTSSQNRWRFKRNILIWARELIARYSGQEANRIYIVPSNTAYDTVNNSSRAVAAPINSRTAKTSERQNNGVHPAAEGYRQIGDAVWAFLKFHEGV